MKSRARENEKGPRKSRPCKKFNNCSVRCLCVRVSFVGSAIDIPKQTTQPEYVFVGTLFPLLRSLVEDTVRVFEAGAGMIGCALRFVICEDDTR